MHAADADGQDKNGLLSDLQQRLQDLEIELTTAVEHGDLVEADLAATNELLQAEIRERQLAEGRLTRVLLALEKRKADLELLVTTLTEHGDVMDAEWLSRFTHMEALSLSDPLTSLGNRRAFDRAFAARWAESNSLKTSLVVAFIDLDFFKSYNDQFGHPAGDRTLKALASELTTIVERDGALAFRYGGEEFVLLWPGVPMEVALSRAEALRQKVWDLSIAHPTTPAGRVTISIGLAHHSGPDSDFGTAEALLSKADACVYAAKRYGRNQIVSAKSTLDVMSDDASAGPYELLLGQYSVDHEGGTGEGLSLSFLPSSLPLQQRWRNNGLSADFLADYVANFWPVATVEADQEAQTLLRDSISFIANELLENAMKYGVMVAGEPITVRLSLLDGKLVFTAANPATSKAIEGLHSFVSRLETSVVEDVHLEALESQAMGGDDSGLGLLTMMVDYDAEVGWKLQAAGTGTYRVTTQVRVPMPMTLASY